VEPLAPRNLATGRVSLSLVPGTRRVGRKGTAGVRVVCATPRNRLTFRPGVCRGHLDLYLRGTRVRVGTARFSVPGGWRRTVRVPLTATALRPLHMGKRVAILARTRAAVAGTRRASATASLTLALVRG
jgi:hypothetical protein